MTGAAWVLSPTDGKAHGLAIVTADGVPAALCCGQPLPLGVVQHGRLPSRQLCRECFAAYLLPAPVFARMTPAGRQLSDSPDSTPGGQPVPQSAPRWARCPIDQRLHLLTPVAAVAAGIKGQGPAGCGRLTLAAGLTIAGTSAGLCMTCLAVGVAR